MSLAEPGSLQSPGGACRSNSGAVPPSSCQLVTAAVVRRGGEGRAEEVLLSMERKGVDPYLLQEL